MSTEAVKPRLSFAKVAASANAKDLPNARALSPQAPTSATNNSSQPARTPGTQAAPDIAISAAVVSAADTDKQTPRPAKSTPVQLDRLQGIIIDKEALNPAASTTGHDGAPVSEENVTRLISARRPISNISFDGKSTTSGTTFPLDEKESLRPDDSASVNAQEDDDGLASTQPSSRVGSDSGARAFSEQLREISTMGPPPSRQPHNLPQIVPAPGSAPQALFQPTPVALTVGFGPIAANLGPDPSAAPFLPDEKLLEALNSVRDRVWVLKLEQDITDFVKDPVAQSFDLPNCNSFYRMLAHKMADYYFLGHTMNESSSGVRLYKTPYCRIPQRLSEVTSPSTAASTPPPSLPQMKILRRSENDTRPSSRDGGLDADSGSDLGKGKFPATREEREARYEAARLRILGSAKPAEEAAALPPKEIDSTSNSVVGRKKTKKQRSDSEDGFEARSAYSMYPQGVIAPGMPHDFGHGHLQSSHAAQSPHGVPMAGAGYGSTLPPYSGEQPWPIYPYGHVPQHGPSGAYGQYGEYDLSMHMQQMSFQQPGMMPYPPYGSLGQMNAQPAYPGMPQPYADPYQSSYPYQPYNGQMPHAYGNGSPNVGKKHNGPQQQAFGAFNRPFFNPQSQAFIPSQAGPTFTRPSLPQTMVSPAISHASAAQSNPQHSQRQTMNQSSNGFHPSLNTSTPQQQPYSLSNTQAKSQNLVHPLPQPVFPQPQQVGGGPGKESQTTGASSTHQQSILAKYASPASLPVKPPPPISENPKMPQFYAQHSGSPAPH